MDRIRPTIDIVKIVNPLGVYCETCVHFIKEPTPGARGGKCTRRPPITEMMQSHGQIVGSMSVRPMIANPKEDWCGEWENESVARSRLKLPLFAS